MLSDSRFCCYAVAGKQKFAEFSYAMDANMDVKVELWKYNPALLSKDGMVDPLSLVMSFEDEENECVQGAIVDMLDARWET